MTAINEHPYITTSGIDYPTRLVAAFDRYAAFEKDILEQHMESPIDVIVGEDVSGRVPTLITHRFLRLAAAAGEIETVPQTYFMASGINNTDDPVRRREVEQRWRKNLTEQAGNIIGTQSVESVVIITDTVDRGTSIDRIESAFRNVGVMTTRKVLGTGWLRGDYSVNPSRTAVGVVKFPGGATSHRRSRSMGFDGEKVGALRHFIDDYAGALYAAVLGAN